MNGEVYAIINPVSGRRNWAGTIARLRRRLSRAGIRLVCAVTQAPGDALRIAADVPDDARAILVVGGDGTIRDVVDARTRRPPPLVVLQSGTENIVAKTLRMPRDPDGLVQRVLHGRPQPVDVGVRNGRKFLIISGMGFDAEVVHRLHATRDGHITHFDYFWPIWRTYWGHQFPRIQVQTDGEPFFDGRGLVFVGVLNRYSLGLQLLWKARHNDGLLDVCIYPCSTRTRLVRHSLETLVRRHARPGGALYTQCRTASVRSPVFVPVQADGDVAGILPADFSLIASGITFLGSQCD